MSDCRNASHFLNQHLTDFCRIVCSAATEKPDVGCLNKRGMLQAHSTQASCSHFPVNATCNALPKGIGLLVDFLVHVVGGIAQFCFAPFFFQHRDVRIDEASSCGTQLHPLPVMTATSAVFEVDHALGVGGEWMGVA